MDGDYLVQEPMKYFYIADFDVPTPRLLALAY